jgi:C-1 hydroxylase
MSTTADTIEANKELLVRAHEAFADADLDGLLKLYAPGITFIDTNDRENPYEGHDAVREYAQVNFYDGLSDLESHVNLEVADENTVIHEGVLYATHSGDLYGIPATGNRITWHFLAIYMVGDGLIQEEHLYCDPREIRSQLEG